MKQCFVVTSKICLLNQLSPNVNKVCSNEVSKEFECSDNDLYNSIRIGDYIGVRNNLIVKRISKEDVLISEFNFEKGTSIINKD